MNKIEKKSVADLIYEYVISKDEDIRVKDVYRLIFEEMESGFHSFKFDKVQYVKR
jgi:hypothetical protein